jgi:hypothetical protein
VPREHEARLARHDALGSAVEQLQPGEVFQVLDPLGRRRRSDVLAGGRTADLSLLDRAKEELP